MRKCFIVSGVVATLTIREAADADVLTFSPIADAFVTNGPLNNLGDNNYGGGGALMVAGANSGKGEFKTLVRFDTSTVKSTFDTTFGVGGWRITAISIRNAGNFASNGQQPNNPFFPSVAIGDFNIGYMANDSWVEGTGNPGGAPISDGITYNTLSSFASANDRTVGTFRWDAPGGTTTQRTWSLLLDSNLVGDVSAGAGTQTSFLYTPAGTVGFLFNAQSFGTVGNRPLLSVTAVAVPEPTLVAFIGIASAMLTTRRRPR